MVKKSGGEGEGEGGPGAETGAEAVGSEAVGSGAGGTGAGGTGAGGAGAGGAGAGGAGAEEQAQELEQLLNHPHSHKLLSPSLMSSVPSLFVVIEMTLSGSSELM